TIEQLENAAMYEDDLAAQEQVDAHESQVAYQQYMQNEQAEVSPTHSDFDSAETATDSSSEVEGELGAEDVQPESLYASPVDETEETIEEGSSVQASPFDMAEEQDEQASVFQPVSIEDVNTEQQEPFAAQQGNAEFEQANEQTE
ncbi:DNA translocase FtsK, partial [Vibrio sp. 10N.222.51.A6]